jgi:hypothetical protein
MLLAMSTFLASTASAQMMIEEIAITLGPSYFGNVSNDTFFIDPNVMGSGISSVTLTSQFGGVSQELTEVTPGEFNCDEPMPSPCDDIDTLAEITALGDLTFTFVGDAMEMDSVTIPLADYDPGAGEVGFPEVVFPGSFATDVPIDATFEWTTPPAWVDAVDVSIEDVATGDTTDEMTFFGDPIFSPVTDTMWAPEAMVANTTYLFELSYFEAIVFQDPRMTTGGRNFLYTGAFESFNELIFTVPEPGVIVLNAAALLTVLGIGRLRGRGRRASA